MTHHPYTKITRIRLENFTAFSSLDFSPSPGINVLIGANGTGKTHLMKVAHAACHISKTEEDYARQLVHREGPSHKAGTHNGNNGVVRKQSRQHIHSRKRNVSQRQGISIPISTS